MSRVEPENDRTSDPSEPPDVHRFGPCTFHMRTQQLEAAGQTVPLHAPARALLAYLIKHRGRAISRDELLREVWRGIVVGEGALRLAVWELRQALGDTGSTQVLIQTVRGHGYRLLGAATAEHAETVPLEGAKAGSAAPHDSSTLVGRSAELAQLEQAAVHALQSGQLCVLSGPAGVGKSRLAREAAARARTMGYACVWGHTEPESASPPLGPWLDMLRQRLEQGAEPAFQRCQQLAPLVWSALQPVHEHDTREAGDRNPELQRSRLFAELARMFWSCAAERPLLLLLEDLQWADEASLAFFTQLSRGLPQGRILLLATSRPTSSRENRELARALNGALREPHGHKLELRGLTLLETEAMLDSTGQPGLAADVHAVTLGNPLLTLELSRLWSRDQPLDRRAALHDRRVEVSSIIGERLDTLTQHGQDVLHAGSLLGHEFSLAELAAVAAKTPPDVMDALDECLESGLLVESPRGRFAFSHPLLRDAAHQGLSRAERCQLHLRAGVYLESQRSELSAGALARLANHYYHAAPLGVAEKAVYYARRAAEVAQDGTAYASAVTYYDHALECADLMQQPSPAQRIDLSIARALAVRAAGSPNGNVHDLLAQLAEEASALDQPELLARAALAYSGQGKARFRPTHFTGSIDARAVSLLERALAGLQGGASETRVLLLCALTLALVYSSDREHTSRLANEAVEQARSLQQPKLLARALLYRAYACASPDTHRSRLLDCNELVDVTEGHRLKPMLIEARMSRAVCLLEVGERQAAEVDESHAVRLLQELGTPRLRARCELLELFRAFNQGHLRLASQLSERCYQANPNDPVAATLYMIRTASIQMLGHGITPATLALQENLVASYPDTVGFRCSLASAYAAFGRTEPALRQFDWVARNSFAALPRDINWLTEMSLLADAAVNIGDHERARAMYEQLRPYGDRWTFYAGEAAPAGPTAHWLAELAITLGDAESTTHWLARARELCARQDAPMFAHISALTEARFLMSFRTAAATERAVMLRRDARAFAEKQGLRLLKVAADALPHRRGTLPAGDTDDNARPPFVN